MRIFFKTPFFLGLLPFRYTGLILFRHGKDRHLGGVGAFLVFRSDPYHQKENHYSKSRRDWQKKLVRKRYDDEIIFVDYVTRSCDYRSISLVKVTGDGNRKRDRYIGVGRDVRQILSYCDVCGSRLNGDRQKGDKC